MWWFLRTSLVMRRSARLAAAAGLAVVLVVAAGPAASRPKPQKTEAPPPAATHQPGEDPTARLMAAIEPFVSHGEGEAGWRFAAPPAISVDGDGGITIRAERVTYVPTHQATIEFPGIEVKAVPDGAVYVVNATLSGEPRLRGADGVWAELKPGENRFSGRWDPKRNAFQTLDTHFVNAKLIVANGISIAMDRLSGRFESTGGETARLQGNINAENIRSQNADRSWWGNVENAALGLELKTPDKAPVLRFNFSDELPQGRFRGVMGELVPLQLKFIGESSPFPWEVFLRTIPVTIGELVAKKDAPPLELWGLLWRQLAAVLAEGKASLTATHVNGRSIGLEATGNGTLKFRPDHPPNGTLACEIRNINERIAELQPSDRKDDPMLFPTLALMTVVGKAVTEHGKRFHRYSIEFSDKGIQINGREVSTLKPTPKE